MQADPFASIAEPSQQSDPFSAIAEKPGSADTTQSQPGDWRDPLTRIEPHQPVHSASDLGREVVRGVGNIGAGGLGMLLRPVATVEGMGTALRHPLDTAKAISEQAQANPLETAESFIGQAGATAGLGELGGAAMRGVGKAIPKIASVVSGTTPRVVGDLVKETQKENVGIGEANKKLGEEHLEATQNALHETEGRELQYRQAVKAAEDEAREKQRELDTAHDKAVQEALHENEGRELAYKQELAKAKLESEEAYQKKLSEVEEKRSKAEQVRRKELRRYLAEKEKVQSDYQKATEKFKGESQKQAKIAPTEEKLKTAYSNLRAGVETAREKAQKIGDTKYSAVNEALSPLPADMEKVYQLYADASDSIGEAQATPSVITRLGKALEKGELLTYADEQKLYSELGRELSKGTLPGNTYHAYDVLHEGLGNDMQRLANSKNMGQQLTDARNYWRRMKQTFGKPLARTDAATKTLRDTAGNLVSAEEQANRVRLLGSFDPRLPGLFEHVENLSKGVESLPNPVPEQTRLKSLVDARKPLPPRPSRQGGVPPAEPVQPRDVAQPLRAEIPDRPGQVQPKIPAPPERVAPPERPQYADAKKIGTGEIEEAKLKSLQKRAQQISHYTARAAMYVTGYRSLVAIGRAMTGDLGALAGLPADLAEGGMVVAGGHAFASFLENPKISRMLIKATPADVAQIPPELRGSLGTIVQEAQKRGIKVSPALIAAVGGAVSGPRKKSVAAALDIGTSEGNPGTPPQ